MRNFSTKVAGFVSVIVCTIVGLAAAASATSADPVADAFNSGQMTLTTYIGLGIGVIVAVLLLGLGVGLLVKYLRKAVRAA